MGKERNVASGALGVVAVVVALGLPPAALAQGSPASARAAWLNLQQIVRQAPGYGAAESTFTKEVQSYQKEIEKLKRQFDSTVTDYQKVAALLSPAAKQAKEVQMRDMTTQLQQRTTDLQTKAQQRERELVQPIEERVRGVIEGVRAERNIAIIFDAGSPAGPIVAADRGLDLTSSIVQRLKAGGPEAK